MSDSPVILKVVRNSSGSIHLVQADTGEPFDVSRHEGATFTLCEEAPQKSFQSRVADWMEACFGPEISKDIDERNFRFLEEALELVQSLGCTRHNAMALVDYVYNRPVGEPEQEVGGVAVTLAALGNAVGIHIQEEADKEEKRCWGIIDKIRAKQRTKPQIGGPLPGHYEDRPMDTSVHAGVDLRIAPTANPFPDDFIRRLWRLQGGKFHGPRVETGTMPEAKLLPFLRRLLIADSASGVMLTGSMIVELAALAGFSVDISDHPSEDEQFLLEDEFIIRPCPAQGVRMDDGSTQFFPLVAIAVNGDDGEVTPLGNPIPCP